jgi:hypothetical protein
MIEASEAFAGWSVQALLFLCLLVMFILPGYVARSVYFSFPFSEGARTKDPVPDAFWALVTGTCIEVGWLWIHRQLTGRWMGSDELAFLLTGSPVDELNAIMMRNMAESRLQLLFFLCTPLAAAAGLGLLARRLVLHTGADIRFPLLRYSNRWYYILSGRMRDDGGRLKPLPADVNYVRLEVLCREGDRHVVYSGRLTEFRLLPGDRIHSFRIRHPFRRYPEVATAEGSNGDGPGGFEAMEVSEKRFLHDDIIDLTPYYYVVKPSDRGPDGANLTT